MPQPITAELQSLFREYTEIQVDNIDYLETIDNLLPEAEFTGNPKDEASYDELVWLDERTKPTHQQLADKWVTLAAARRFSVGLRIVEEKMRVFIVEIDGKDYMADIKILPYLQITIDHMEESGLDGGYWPTASFSVCPITLANLKLIRSAVGAASQRYLIGDFSDD